MNAALAPHPLDQGHPPRWASEWGEDRRGVFAGFTAGEVSHRLRWIPPGRFRMGSPESEAGRYDNEGPQHEVTLSRGFWLGEVPCTQALWDEVMGENPSEFRSPDRPVERVSWNDCRRFLETLGERCPGLDPRLPTEAEWEYACRAGTRAGAFAGDLEILGENDAPLLDAIAWYGGNSGVDFELEGGWDSSGWPEKQYPHERAGTHPAGRKDPNPWGLHDMLGNVWEWCSDWHGPYQAGPVVDPQGPGKGSNRVLRGGSWALTARLVRAAVRRWFPPGVRGGDLGFRLARGQEEER